MRFATGLAILLPLYGSVVAARVRPAVRVPLHLALGGLLVAAGRAAGLSMEEMGLSGEAVGPGLRWGGAVALGLAAALGAGLAVPRIRRIFRDERVAGLTRRALAFRLLLHIPIATALFEEVAFRGVLLGSLLELMGEVPAVAVSSAVFGVWHIGPALDRLAANRPGAGRRSIVLEVCFTVAVTTAGGVLFALLRIHTGGIVAPAVAHLAANVLATLAAVRLTRETR